MKNRKSYRLFVLSVAGVFSFGSLLAFSIHRGATNLFATGNPSYSCASIYFGETRTNTNYIVTDLTGRFTTSENIESVSIVASGSVYLPKNVGTGNMPKLGKGTETGALHYVVTFNEPVNIAQMSVTCAAWSTDSSGVSAPFTLTVEGGQHLEGISTNNTLQAYTLPSPISGPVSSLTFTIANTETATTATLSVSNVTFKLTPGSSDSNSSEESSSSSQTTSSQEQSESSASSSSPSSASSVDSDKEFMMYFSEMFGAQYGDGFLLKYGDWECLVDGGQSNNRTSISNILKTYCTDHVLDMFIGTHSHEDHLGLYTDDKVFSNAGVTSIGTIVDSGDGRSAQFYDSYKTLRDNILTTTYGASYYPVGAIFTQNSSYSDAYGKSSFVIDDSFSLNFLNSGKYLAPGVSSGEPNRTSVCCYVKYKNNYYIFTGDGNEDTEKGLIANYSSNKPWANADKIYFKAAHHGSSTSNTADFLAFLSPDHVMVSSSILSSNRTSSGVTNAQHPYKDAIDRINKYTFDVHWTGVNGALKYITTSSGGDATFTGQGRTVDYYHNGSIVSRSDEKDIVFGDSKWVLSTGYAASDKSGSHIHELYDHISHSYD